MEKKYNLPLKVKMVMIDLDGTLIDTAPDIAESANRMLADLNMPRYATEMVATWIGNGISRLVKRALTGSLDGEPEKALFERGHQLFLKHYAVLLADKSCPFPGVLEGLEALQEQGYILVCITNKAKAFTVPLLKQLNMEPYFKLILSGDSLPKRKPDPLPLLHACAQFNIRPEEGVLIGDSGNDTQAARAAGMPVICVTYGYNRGMDVHELYPDAVIDSLMELSKYLIPHASQLKHKHH